MLDGRRLAVLKAVVDAGSVTAAAGDLRYTPSAVSQTLASLERDTKLQLFEKVGRGIRPTHAGRRLAEHAALVIAQLQRAEEEMEALRSGRVGALRLVAFATAGASLVPRALAYFNAEHPGVDLDVSIAETDDALGALRAGDIDLALIGLHDAVDTRGRDLVYTQLLEDPYRLVVPRAHRFADRRVVRLEEFRDESWISTASARCNCEPTVTAACMRAGFAPRFVFEADEFATTVGFVGAGLGIAMIPQLALTAVPEDVRVVKIRTGEPKRLVYSVVRRSGAGNPVIDEIERSLRHAAGKRALSVA
jgi:DNA-binding transcriptional LysR family regulator